MMGAKARVCGANRGTVLAGGLMVTTALAIALVATPAWAQQAAASTPMIAQLQSERSFDIPAQPLTDALVAFGQQSGIQVTVDGTVARNVSSPAVRGTMTSEQALRRLLAGSGLTYTMSGSTVAIEKPGQKNGDGATMLGPITVQADGIPSQAEIGNLPPPYAGGQVATGAKLGLLGNRDFMDTPFNQTSYTSKLIEDQQSRTLGDVLSNDPSVTNASATASSGVEGFNIRGFSSSNGDVYFNGLSGIAPTYGSVMSMIGTERVEVLKGPNALLNGITPGGSIGGAINIVPKRAGAQPLTEFTPSYGSEGQGGGHIDVGRRFGEDESIGIRLNALYRNGDTAVDRQSQETRAATLGLDFQGDFIRLSADGGYQFQHTSAIRRALRLAAGVPVPDAPESRSNYSQPWSFLDVETLYGVVRGEVDIVENLTAYATFGAARSHFSELRSAVTVLDAQGTIQTSAFEISNRDEKMALEAGLRGSLATGFVHHDMTLANTISWEEGGTATGSGVVLPNSNLYDSAIFPKPSFAVLPPDPGDSPKWLEQQNSSLAAADTMSVLDERIQLTVGVRYQQVNADNFDTTTGARTSAYDENAITPAVGLIVKPLDHLSLYANYIEGLSPGSVAPTTAANAGEIFPPTKTKQHEIGVKFDFGQLATTLSAFQIAQPNAFLDPTSNLFGVDGEQRNRGVELSVFGEVTSDVRVLGGVTYLDAELTKTQGGVNNGNQPAGVPKVRVTAGLEWDTPFAPGLTLSARGIYNGSSYLDQANTLKLPAWSRFDLGARYSLKVYDTPVVVRANVLNIFDNDYWDAGGLSLSEPRTFLLSATVDF